MSENRVLRVDYEIRANETGGTTIVGFPIVFNSLSGDLGGFRERIDPGAFTRALAVKQDVRALVDHDPQKILGRVGAGTLRLQVTDKGVRSEIDVPDTSYGRDLLVSLRRGDLDKMSFGFSRAKDTWAEEVVDGKVTVIRTLRDADLHDVSVVTFPAYPETEVAAEVAVRSLQVYLSTRPVHPSILEAYINLEILRI